MNQGRLSIFCLVFGILCAGVTRIESKKTGPDPSREVYRSGQENCPCFCSERGNENKHNTFWVDKYPVEEDIEEKFQCGSTDCLEPSDYAEDLGFCKEHVNYPFCPRQLTGLNATTTSGLIKKLVEDAFACWDTTVWEEGTECDNTVKRGACYTVFPRCSQAGINKPEPKKICRSFCENERRVCRTLKSAFGPNEYIRDICSVDPWVDADGPSETCTGAGSNVYVSNVRWLAACICFVHALFLAMLSN